MSGEEEIASVLFLAASLRESTGAFLSFLLTEQCLYKFNFYLPQFLSSHNQ